MPNFYMMVGIPGSGKTTWAENLIREQKEFAHHEIIYVCPDDIRFQLTGDASDQTRNATVWNTAYHFVRDALQEDKSVLIDATFVKTKDRRKMLSYAQRYGATHTYVYICNPSLEQCKARNAKRDRVVPEHVLDRMYEQLNIKDIEKDGFDVILDVELFNEVWGR